MAAATATVPDAERSERRGQVYVALAALAWSTAGVLQRGLSVDTPTQVAARAAFAFVALVAYVAVAERGRVIEASRAVGLAGIGFGVSVAVASGAFIVALNHTSVAHVLFIQAMAPVLAALLAWLALGEPVTARTAIALVVALAGVAVMIGGPGGGSLLGDGLSLGMALSFAVSIVISRHRKDVSMAPATCLAQVLLVVVFLPFATPAAIPGDDLLALAALGGGQIGVGLVLLTLGARLIPAAQVALITLLEVVLGPLWVWFAIGEKPTAATLVGGAIVVVAVARRGINLAPFDELADPRIVARLAARAEERGWDGVFVWDHICYSPPVRGVADPWVTLAAIACATERVTIGPLVTPPSRRRVHKLARETVTLDHLSGGRLVLGLGLGADRHGELAPFGEVEDPRERARLLDAALERLTAYWGGELEPPPLQRPRIPVWLAARWPNRRPVRRAARWDGLCPIDLPGPDALAELVEEARAQREEERIGDPFDVVVTNPPDEGAAPWAAAGATWCLTGFGPRPTADAVRAAIDAGPQA